MHFGPVNLSEVLLILAPVALLVVICAVVLWLKVQDMARRTEESLLAFKQQFLQDEYARIASESAVWQQELLDLIREVQKVAGLVKADVRVRELGHHTLRY